MQVILGQSLSQQQKLKIQELIVHFLQSVNFSLLHMVPPSCNKENVISCYKVLEVVAIPNCSLQVNVLCCKTDEHFGLVFAMSNLNRQGMRTSSNACPKAWGQTYSLPGQRSSYKPCCWNGGEAKLENKCIFIYLLLLHCILILQLVSLTTYILNDNWQFRNFMILILIFLMDFLRKNVVLGQSDLPKYGRPMSESSIPNMWFM